MLNNKSMRKLSLTVCLIGVISGAVMIKLHGNGDIFAFFSKSKNPVFSVLYEIYTVPLLILSGLSVIGFIAVFPLVFWKGYTVGCVFGLAFSCGAADSVKYSAAYFPAALLYIITVSYVCGDAFIFSIRVFGEHDRTKLRRDIPTYLLKMLIYLILLTVAAS